MPQNIYHNEVAAAANPWAINKALIKAMASYDVYAANVYALQVAEHNAAVLAAREARKGYLTGKDNSPWVDASNRRDCQNAYAQQGKDILFNWEGENKALNTQDSWERWEQRYATRKVQEAKAVRSAELKAKRTANKLKAKAKKIKFNLVNKKPIFVVPMQLMLCMIEALMVFKLICMLCKRVTYKTNTKPSTRKQVTVKSIRVNHPVDRKLKLETRWKRREIFNLKQVYGDYRMLAYSFTQTTTSSVLALLNLELEELEAMIDIQRNSYMTKLV